MRDQWALRATGPYAMNEMGATRRWLDCSWGHLFLINVVPQIRVGKFIFPFQYLRCKFYGRFRERERKVAIELAKRMKRSRYFIFRLNFVRMNTCFRENVKQKKPRQRTDFIYVLQNLKKKKIAEWKINSFITYTKNTTIRDTRGQFFFFSIHFSFIWICLKVKTCDIRSSLRVTNSGITDWTKSSNAVTRIHSERANGRGDNFLLPSIKSMG